MSERKPKITKKDEVERKERFEKSLEVNYMLLLIERYPQKARDAVKKLFDKSFVIN